MKKILKIKKPAVLKQFFYVVAYTDPSQFDAACFRHWRVWAKNKEHAYSVGMAKHDDKIEGELCNNYVIAFPKP